MVQKIAKTATLSGENLDGDTVELELALISQKGTWTNDINSFAKPQEQPPQRRALNLNRWELPRQVTMSMTDRFVAENHNGNGDRPNLNDKEEWLDEVYKLAVAQNILELKVSNDKTIRESDSSDMPHSVTSGFVHNLDFTEKAGQDNSTYEVTLKMVDEVPMNS